MRTIVNGALDTVISADGGTVYASDPSGYVTGYDLDTGAQTGRWQVGIRLAGMDVSADGRYLVAVERQDPDLPYSVTDIPATLHRLDLTTGQVNDFTAIVHNLETAFHDVAFMADGKVVLTQNFRGSGWVPLTTLDFATSTFTRSGSYSQSGVLSPALDHSSVLFAPENNSGGPLYLVSSSSGAVTTPNLSFGGYNYGVQAYSAGHFAAQYVYSNLYIYDGTLKFEVDLTVAHPELRTTVGGLAFDATGSHLYVWQSGYNRVLKFSTADWSIESSFSVGANTPASNWNVYGNGLNVSADGQYLVVTGQSKVQAINLATFASDGGTDHDDTLVGTSGADVFDAYKGADYVSGGLGSDQIHGGDGDDFLAGEGIVTAGQASLAGSDSLWGDAGNDALFGGGGVDYLYGGAGDDRIFTAGAQFQSDGSFQLDANLVDPGADYIDGGTGTDTAFLYLNNLTQSVSINLNTDLGVPNAAYAIYVAGNARGSLTSIENLSVYTGSGSDTLTGGAGGDTLSGGGGDDVLAGNGGGDTLDGGAGDDQLTGGGGGDALFGGAGTNVFVFASAADSNNAQLDIIHDFKAGVDRLDLAALTPSNVSILHYNGGTFVNGGSGAVAFQIGSVNAINGSDIVGLTNGVYLVGENVSATLVGSAKDDTVVGGSANDTIIGGDTGDALFGGAGADTFLYRSASESNPNAGQMDIIHDFQTGVDKLDLTALGASNVSILHYQGGTFIAGASALGTFQIASMKDINATDIVGLISGAYIVGDELGNILIGNGFSETIVGGAGNDVIIGGGAADALFGGAGADTFKFMAKGDSTPAASDIIHDFQTGVDKIDLTALHTNGAADHYSLISDATASYLFVQLAGNPANDLQILFTNPNVQASDILW